ncbi:MAG: hypothetical protein D6731_20795 [Planctomycetota bacterium]|nr:MAG: hypothetical protein D6731_20795 [Planctomycetota bacterium]
MISVGLELGGNTIKLAVLEGSPRAPRLKAFDVRKVAVKEGEAEDDIVSVLEDLLKKTRAPRGQVVCSVRAQDCMIREIVVPFVDDDKIRKTIKYQAENYFTSLSIDDLIIEYSKFAELDGKAKLMVAGVKKSHIDRRLRYLDECGIDPTHIDLDVAALYNTYKHMGVFEDRGAVLLVEIEADTLKVGVVEEGRLRLARAIRMRLGAMKLEQGRGRSGMGRVPGPGASETQADESARLPVVILDDGEDEAFSLEDSNIGEVEREGILHRIFMEIDRTVASVQLQSDVELICLSGASCKLDGIEEVFADHFEVEAQRVSLESHFKAPRDAPPHLSLNAPTAVGLALKGMGVDHARMDFRQEEFVYQGTFAQLRRGLACAMTLLFALVFLYAFNLKHELRETKNAVDGVKSLQRDLYTVLFPSLEDDSVPHLDTGRRDQNYYEAMRAAQRELSRRYGGGAAASDDGPQISALEVLRQFALAKAAVPPRRGIVVMKASVDPRPGNQSTFNCRIQEPEGAVELARRFEKNPVFLGTAQDTRRDRRTGQWSFEFVIKLRDQGRR